VVAVLRADAPRQESDDRGANQRHENDVEDDHVPLRRASRGEPPVIVWSRQAMGCFTAGPKLEPPQNSLMRVASSVPLIREAYVKRVTVVGAQKQYQRVVDTRETPRIAGPPKRTKEATTYCRALQRVVLWG
jgi:hypothetical protein